MQVHCCGTVRSNRRGLPTDMGVDKSSPRDSYAWRCLTNNPMRAVFGFWMDNKLTRFLTNIHCSTREPHSRGKKKKFGGDEEVVMKPVAVKGYIDYMQVCDVRDQHRSCYEIRVKSHKWTQHFFYWIVDMAVCNGYELFVSYYVKDRSKYFERDFCKRLLKQMPERAKKMRMSARLRGLRRRSHLSLMKKTPGGPGSADKYEPADDQHAEIDMRLVNKSRVAEDNRGKFHLLFHMEKRKMCKVCLEEKILSVRSKQKSKDRTSAMYGMDMKGVRKVATMCAVSNAAVCEEHFQVFCNTGKCKNYVSGRKVKRATRTSERKRKKPGPKSVRNSKKRPTLVRI